MRGGVCVCVCWEETSLSPSFILSYSHSLSLVFSVSRARSRSVSAPDLNQLLPSPSPPCWVASTLILTISCSPLLPRYSRH